MATTIDRSDTKRALAHHVSGDEYVVEYCSVWEDEHCVGAVITQSLGPIPHAEIPEGDAIYTWIRDCPNLDGMDADWLQSEDDAGRVTYPYGAR